MEEREIVNHEANERIVFRVIAAESNGELLEMDDFWGTPSTRSRSIITPKWKRPGT